MFPEHSTDDQANREADLSHLNDNIMRGSLGTLFRHLVASDDGSSAHHRHQLASSTSTPTFANAPGDDYKRLVEKSRVKRQMTKSTSEYSIASLTSSDSMDDDDDDEDYHAKAPPSPLSPTRQNTYGFAVGHPIILPIPPHHESHKRITVVDKLYDWFFAREDRYFNADRRELSKDIFPAAARDNSRHKMAGSSSTDSTASV